MKRLLPCTAVALAIALTSTPQGRAESLEPGEVDFGDLSTLAAGGTFVDVNVGKSLIGLAARFASADEPEIAKLLDGLHRIQVKVIGITAENRPALEKHSRDIRKYLDAHGWDQVVSAHTKDQDASVHLKLENDKTVAGLAIVALDGKGQAAFVNVVGNIKPEQLATVGEQLHIDALRKFGRPAPKEQPESEP